MYNETSQIMVSYDDAKAFEAKGQFIATQNLRGFAMWEAGSRWGCPAHLRGGGTL